MLSRDELPEFRKHGFDRKFLPLEEADFKPPPRHINQLLDFLSVLGGGSLSEMKILDLGCGRGELVGALRERGARAYGIEIDPRFVRSGAVLETLYTSDYPLLTTVDQCGKSIFPDGYFDIVVSDQVLEHVADLGSVTREISRVLKPKGFTCHQFPARLRIVEPHYRLPFVHWLPKNRLRRVAIKSLLSFGMSNEFFPQYGIDDRTSIIFKYSVEETFYRKLHEIESAFASEGLKSEFRRLMHAYVESRLRRRVPYFLPVPELVSTFRMVMFCAQKRA